MSAQTSFTRASAWCVMDNDDTLCVIVVEAQYVSRYHLNSIHSFTHLISPKVFMQFNWELNWFTAK